jgi:hypothetical protein
MCSSVKCAVPPFAIKSVYTYVRTCIYVCILVYVCICNKAMPVAGGEKGWGERVGGGKRERERGREGSRTQLTKYARVGVEKAHAQFVR